MVMVRSLWNMQIIDQVVCTYYRINWRYNKEGLYNIFQPAPQPTATHPHRQPLITHSGCSSLSEKKNSSTALRRKDLDISTFFLNFNSVYVRRRTFTNLKTTPIEYFISLIPCAIEICTETKARQVFFPSFYSNSAKWAFRKLLAVYTFQ